MFRIEAMFALKDFSFDVIRKSKGISMRMFCKLYSNAVKEMAREAETIPLSKFMPGSHYHTVLCCFYDGVDNSLRHCRGCCISHLFLWNPCCNLCGIGVADVSYRQICHNSLVNKVGCSNKICGLLTEVILPFAGI